MQFIKSEIFELWSTWTCFLFLHQTFKRFWDAGIKKSLVLLDKAFVLQNKKGRGKVPSYLITFAVIRNFVTFESHTFKAVIDLGSPFNLISQIKVKEMQLLGRLKPKQKPHDIDDNLLHIYLEHKLETVTTDSAGQIIGSTDVFLGADIEGFDVILGRP